MDLTISSIPGDWAEAFAVAIPVAGMTVVTLSAAARAMSKRRFDFISLFPKVPAESGRGVLLYGNDGYLWPPTSWRG